MSKQVITFFNNYSNIKTTLAYQHWKTLVKYMIVAIIDPECLWVLSCCRFSSAVATFCMDGDIGSDHLATCTLSYMAITNSNWFASL